ncbi:MAG: hypothetical protein IJS08_02725 [Victivallales bacterium]|nr:hypothetical protein [Victivallales bacterium]
MDIKDLPIGSFPKCLDYRHFPTHWQLFLWRNWEVVRHEKIAEILGCTLEQVREAADELGLPNDIKVSPKWLTNGYLTLIRKNWQLLDYEQLLQLLDWTPERMAYALKEEGFLFTKLGRHKPDCPKIKYVPLTPEQKKETQDIVSISGAYFRKGLLKYQEQPFSFMDTYPGLPIKKQRRRFEFNFIHSYAASCGDVFGEAEKRDPVPENLLKRYSALGVNGIWVHALLYLLYPIPGAEEYSIGREKRLRNLKDIVRRCAKYGMKLYLYLNEPRWMPPEFYDKKPQWKGIPYEEKNSWYICTTRSREPLEWLESTLKWLFAEVPDLGGIFCITQSENATHCHSHTRSRECPYCSKVPPEQIIADVISAMERGMHASAPDAKMIAYDWSWTRNIGDLENASFKKAIIDLLPKNVYLNSVSEWGMITEIAGVKQHLVDYSISQVGPSQETLDVWRHAKKAGLKICAKVQLNNSWEMSAVPYIPVPFLVQEHLDNLAKARVDGLMLSWTLGGYPGGNLALLSATPEELAASRFNPKLAAEVIKAERIFSEAFRQFPFNVSVLYYSPVNYGPMNLLHLKPSGYKASMVGFPYDDVKKWCGPYDPLQMLTQINAIISGWSKGMEILQKAQSLPQNETEAYELQELTKMVLVTYLHFNSTNCQLCYTLMRDEGEDHSQHQKELILQEIHNACILFEIVRRDSRIGFEASNHYYYTLNDLAEKVINCKYILEHLQ